MTQGEDTPYVMAQMGHRDPKETLGIYAKVMHRRDGEREPLRALVRGERAPKPAFGLRMGYETPPAIPQMKESL